jgi:hypothetical protein
MFMAFYINHDAHSFNGSLTTTRQNGTLLRRRLLQSLSMPRILAASRRDEEFRWPLWC